MVYLVVISMGTIAIAPLASSTIRFHRTLIPGFGMRRFTFTNASFSDDNPPSAVRILSDQIDQSNSLEVHRTQDGEGYAMLQLG